MVNITINSDGSTSQDVISLGSQFENLDDTIQFAFPSNLEGLNKYVVAKTYDDSKKENITRVTPLVDNKFIVGRAITKVTGQWLLYTLCKAYSPSGDVERVSISDPIVATVTENDFDISEIEATELDPNIKIVYDELVEFKKTLEANEATRQKNEASRVTAENERLSNETARDNEEHTRQANEAQRAKNETNRASAETARATAESERAKAETARTNAEATRKEAEDKRITDEAVRATNESTRVASESQRVQTEVNRQANEKTRSEAEKTRVQNEQERKQAEANRASAETTRQSNEEKRINAETNRATAEQKRAEAETTRLNNETARVDTEKLRATAETARDTAEKARAEAEAKRDGTINALKDSVDSKITKFYATNNGDTRLADSDNGKIMDMLIYGKASQEGTPTIENPIDVKNVVNPTIKLRGSNLLKLDFKQNNNNGITLEVVGNKLRFHGTFTNTYAFFKVKNKPLIKKNTKVSLYVDNYNDHGAFAWLELLSNGNINSLTKTSPTNTLTGDNYLNSIGIENYNVGDTVDFTTTIAVLDNTNKYEPYKEQTLTLPITLNAVPVSSGGNVTIGGQQYVADYVDVERGKIVIMTKTVHPKEASDISTWSSVKETVSNFRTYAEGADKKEILSNMMINRAIWADDVIGVSGIEYNFIDFTLPYTTLGIDKSATHEQRNTAINAWLKNNDLMFVYILKTPTEEDLTTEQAKALRALKTYYPTTNILVDSSQLKGYTVFNYPISMANGWNYVKSQLNDTRDYIYDIDVQSAEAYVNSEYAMALTELGV